MSDLIIIILLVLAIVIIFYGLKIFRKKPREKFIESTVLLEKIKKVCKLITVQGEFSEIINYQDSKNVLLNILGFEKKALIIVKARTLIGFDLAKIKIHADVKNKKLIFQNFPDAEVISIDTDIQYYDIQQTTFNKFSADAYTKLNRKAKETINDKVLQSELPSLAKKQAIETLSVLDAIAETAGWHIVYDEHILPENKPKSKLE